MVNFTPHLIPVNRGIFTTIYASYAEGVQPADIGAALHEQYDKEPFVRLLGEKGMPDIKHVTSTNFVDIAWRTIRARAVSFSSARKIIS